MEKINKCDIFKELKLHQDFIKNIKLFYVFETWSDNLIIVTNDDKTFTFGDNSWGVLGFGHKKQVKMLTLNEKLSYKQIVDFKNSRYHTIARTIDGKIYCWGSNDWGFLGNGRNDYLSDLSFDLYGKIYKPELNQYMSDKNIIDICCGFGHSLVLTIDGQVYAWGLNSNGQVGNGIDKHHVSIPCQVNGFNGEIVKMIACGSGHSMALTEKGNVFSWGNNESGQLGFKKLKENDSINAPKLITISETIDKISCGYDYSLLLSRDGDIYTFGNNQYGQIGHEKIKEKSETPFKLKAQNKFIDIASHSRYWISMALSKEGVIFIWGYCGRVVRTPKETQFNSFQESFAYYQQKTYKLVFEPFQEIDFETPLKLKNNNSEQKFNEICIISSGSFGTVCKVYERNSKIIFAIKKIPMSDDQKEKICKESEIIAKSSGNYVVRCYDFWIEENYILKRGFEAYENSDLSPCHEIFNPNKPLLLHIQMELCYKTLREIVKIFDEEMNQKPNEIIPRLNYYVSSELFKEILESLDYLHKQDPQIIHRDLKPANILITNGSNGRFIKLADFGLAVYHESEDQSHTQGPGTDKYMAPEVRESRYYDVKSDIYSLGVIVKELFSLKAGLGKRFLDSNNKIKIEDLINKMTSNFAEKRPKCDDILNRKDLWDTSFDQFVEEKDIISKEIMTIGDSFHLYFIKTKLSQRSSTPNIKRYEQDFNEIGIISFGTFGIIAKAVEKKSNEIFAINKIPLNSDHRSNVLEELKMLISVKSEFLIEFHDFWVEDNYHVRDDYSNFEGSAPSSYQVFIYPYKPLLLYIKMELLFNSLKDVIQILNDELNQTLSQVMSPFGYYISSELFIELLESLDYLHKRNIIHRNLRPSNILITDGSNGRFVKLAQFGSAITQECNQQTHTQVLETDKYMAPEVIRGKNYDFKADIYSLGFIIQELFNIDIDDPVGENTKMESKYSNLFNLIEHIIAPAKARRPNCGQILNERNSWALSSNELMIDKDFDKDFENSLNEIETIEESFHLYFIQKKILISKKLFVK